MYRDEEYDLRGLEYGLDMTSEEIIQGMSSKGWSLGESTLSRLRTGSDVKIDVAGLPDYAIECLFATCSGVAEVAQKANLQMRQAMAKRLPAEKLDEELCSAEGQIGIAERRYDKLKVAANATTDEERDEAILDKACILEARGQLAAHRELHLAALKFFLAAYDTLLPVVWSSHHVGIKIVLGRSLSAAVNAAFNCDEHDGKLIGRANVGPDWKLDQVLKHYRAVRSPINLLIDAVQRTGDDRMAANHADAFALAKKPSEAARMLQLGLSYARGKVTLEKWTPPGRNAPVICEAYMEEAVTQYDALEVRRPRKNRSQRTTGAALKTLIAAIVSGVLAALILVSHEREASARPGPVSSILSVTKLV